MFTAGTTVARYEILGFLGAGGMGEVYRARDLTLDRVVAIKTIRRRDAAHPESRLRFDQERRLAATLEHPHICRILDAGSTDGIDFIVMEFLEGQSLADRLASGPLPLRDLVGYGIEIASGLQYAHSHGIVHRDLKPGNVFLTRTGVKLLDFGLATWVAPVNFTAEGEISATAQMAMTAEGTIAGTAHYLAPERLEGTRADHRSDIWAFGLVLYEMATGKRAFEATTPARQIAAILNQEPPPLDRSIPYSAELEWIIRECLRKEPDDRWQAAGDVGTMLRRIAIHAPSFASASPPAAWRRGVWIYAALATVVLLGLGAALVTGDRERHTGIAPIAFEIPPPLGSVFTPTEGSIRTAQLALSPDARWLTFVAEGGGGQAQLWVRALNSVESRPLAGTAGASFPFWSPDSRSIGFFAHGILKRVDLTGTPPQMLAPAPNGRGGAWNPDGVIVFSPATNSGLSRIDASGGSVSPVTALSEQRADNSHRWPQFLPDGRRFICFVRSSDRLKEGIYLGALDSSELKMLVQASYGAAFAPPEHLLYVADSSLIARRIDIDRARLDGEGTIVTEDIGRSSNFYAALSVSQTGMLAYARNAAAAELVWIDRHGQRVGTVAAAGRYVDFRLSADGSRTAVAAVESGAESSDIRVVGADGSSARLTAGRATDASPVWSPDGKWIVFRSNRDRVHDLYIRASAGPASENVFLRTGAGAYPTDWSPDGQTIVYHSRFDSDTGWDIWGASRENPEKREAILRTPFNEVQGQISPDGQWLAYTSDESGAWEVYVQSRSQPEKRWQVSAGGGWDPKWRRDGKELCYVSEDPWLMGVPILPGRPPGPPARLLEVPPAQHVAPYLSAYEIHPNGDRFLVRVPLESARTAPLQLRANWSPPQP